LQRQADDDRQGAGGGQYTLDRQIQHVGQGGDDGDEKNHCPKQILKQAPGVPNPLHHHRANQYRERACAEQPPTDLQAGCGQVQRHIVGPGRRFQRVQAFVEQQDAEQRKDHQPRHEFPLAAIGTDQAPQPQIDEDQGQRTEQRVIGEQ